MIKLTVTKCLKTHFKTENVEYCVKYSWGQSPFGLAIIATVSQYVVYLKFYETLTEKEAGEIISKLHPDAKSVERIVSLFFKCF